MNSKQFILLFIALIVLCLVAVVLRPFVRPPSVYPSPTPTPVVSATPTLAPVACTMEAKMCPDGSYVGRSGPNCDFAMCPAVNVSTTSATFSASLGQRTTSLGLSILLVEVIEDSRCPLEVQCIQAGTVRVRGEVTSQGDTAVQIFSLGKAVTIKNRTITLIQVLPDPHSGTSVLPSSYRFTFEIKK